MASIIHSSCGPPSHVDTLGRPLVVISVEQTKDVARYTHVKEYGHIAFVLTELRKNHLPAVDYHTSPTPYIQSQGRDCDPTLTTLESISVPTQFLVFAYGLSCCFQYTVDRNRSPLLAPVMHHHIMHHTLEVLFDVRRPRRVFSERICANNERSYLNGS